LINKVEISGVNTSKLPVLSNEEKKELLIKVKKGDKNARQKFISCNLKLVLSVIKKFNNRQEDVDDLFQIGCVGLIKAIDNFNPDLNVQFSTYAVPMIIGEIRRYLRDNNPIRVSRSIRDLAYKALAFRDKYVKQNQKDPTLSEISNALNVSKEELSACLDAIQEPVSLQEAVHSSNDSDNLYVMDQISDKKDNDENWSDRIALLDSLDKLSERERQIIKLRFFECKTQVEVSSEIGISQAQVSRLEKSAIKNIRRHYI
jgi:RNA polymerase sporulation-specific sigma factor